jgi:N6-adenosine-specific RNA methylase IME4
MTTPSALTLEKRARRAERERELGARLVAMPNKLYGVLYADPAWRFTVYSRLTGLDRSADNHYATMSLAGIKALKVPAAPNAVLFLWVTVPFLQHGLDVMTAWGFTYKSNLVWTKDRTGTGFWFRNAHELLLVGTRGNIPAPAPGTRWKSVLAAPVGRHSAKPPEVRSMIETLFPTLPRIELFAREQADGWDVWGDEVTGERP